MSEPRVVLHPRHPFGVDTFLESMPGIVLERPQDNDEVAACLHDGAEVLVTYTWREDFSRRACAGFAGAGAGTEQYPLELLAAHGVTLTSGSRRSFRHGRRTCLRAAAFADPPDRRCCASYGRTALGAARRRGPRAREWRLSLPPRGAYVWSGVISSRAGKSPTCPVCI